VAHYRQGEYTSELTQAEDDEKYDDNDDHDLFGDLKNKMIAAEARNQKHGLDSVPRVANDLKCSVVEKSLKFCFQDTLGKFCFSDALKFRKNYQSLYPNLAKFAYLSCCPGDFCAF
jgi:hypothetical protein